MKSNIFFSFTCFLIIFANFAYAKNDIGKIFKLSDVRKELLEASSETSTAESKDDKDACQTDEDCLYLGTCKDDKGQKFCSCRKGTSGKKCEIIDECVKVPDMCGDEEYVKCDYDISRRKAFCKCSDKSNRFDIPKKKCVVQKPCTEQKECRNGGVCTDRGEAKYCECLFGTSGDFCERIEECVNKPTLCGSGDDVKCEFNVRQERAYCQCENQNLRFDWPQKKCVERKLCRENDECAPFGVCTNKCQDYEPCYGYDHIEVKNSCHCIEGTSGDNCEVVDDCYNKAVDCGSGDNVVCTYFYIRGLKGHAYCKCKKDEKKYDSVAKLCKDCDCGAMGDSCSFKNGQKVCTCKPLSYNHGDRCEDCKCGEGSNGCSFEEGNKKCFCNPGFIEVSGRCERCDCGKNSTGCKFVNGQKVCTCEAGFTEGNYGICTPMCNDKRKCANGGLCLQNVCVCLAGTGGLFCEVVYDCENKMCGEHQNVSCKYDTKNQRAFCQCQNTDSVFDTFDKTCKMCECDRSSYDKSSERCEFVHGKKVCHCKEGYAHSPDLDICFTCDCGINSTSCSFNEYGKRVCGCEDGFTALTEGCKECDCGKNGVCRYIEEMDNVTKMCFCNTGYEDYKGTCVKCDCGPNGKCVYSSAGKILKCSCETGYAEDTGKCKICDCGPDSKCSFKSKRKYCQCPTGFESVRGYCRDKNECLVPESCPESGTLCVNTIGSFKCECKPGYIQRPSGANVTPPLCTKQEEKEPNYKPWKIGYGLLTAGFMVIIIGLVIVIFKIRRLLEIC